MSGTSVKSPFFSRPEHQYRTVRGRLLVTVKRAVGELDKLQQLRERPENKSVLPITNKIKLVINHINK